VWALALPVSFLAMTWASAWRYYRRERERARWKRRVYEVGV
jgi:hypothetical protein